MTNTRNVLLIALFFASCTLTIYTGVRHLVGASDGSGDVTDVDADTDAPEEVDVASGGSGDDSGDATEDDASATLCSPSERSACFLDLPYSTVAELELCGNGNLPLIDITPPTGPMADANATMYMCPEYMSDGAESPIDIILMAIDGVVFSVSEAHTYDDLSDLVEANRVTMGLYGSACTPAHSQILVDGFSCDVDGREISVAITASSAGTDHVLIINFISDMTSFAGLLELL